MSKGKRLHVDLCCGLGGWQEPFQQDRMWTSVGIDIRKDLDPDVVADVRELPLSACEPTLLTMSPPCQQFSSAWNRWTHPDDRDIDLSIWNACLEAVDKLQPEWWVMENVAQAQRWVGPSRWNRGAWHLWGEFPPLDTGRLRPKGATWNQDPSETAKIPQTLAYALKRSVEVFGNV